MLAGRSLDIPALLRVRSKLAAGRPLNEQLGVVAGRRIAAPDDAAMAKLAEDPAREGQQLAGGQVRE
jgi:hypothetical protein